MTLVDGIDDLAERIAEEVNLVRSEVATGLSGKSSTSHNHDGSYASSGHNHSGVYAPVSHFHAGEDITSGTVAIGRLPTGTSGTTIALGNAAAGLIATHEGASDPHPGYLTPAEGNAAYSVLAHNHSGTYQPLHAILTALAGLTIAANKLPYGNGSNTFAVTDLTSFARSILDDADAATVLATLGVSSFVQTILDDANAAAVRSTIGAQASGSYQTQDTTLDNFAALTIAANKLPYGNGSDTFALADFTSAARALLDDADASAMLTTLGLSTFVKTLMDDADASAFLTTLGVSTYAKTLLDDADASTALSTLGVSTFIKTLLDDTDAATARATLGILPFGVVALSDGATVNTDASLGRVFRLAAMAGNRTFAVPTNPTDGQVITYEITASGADRTPSFASGTGGFALGTDITVISAITSATTNYITWVYNSTAQRWRLLAQSRGY